MKLGIMLVLLNTIFAAESATVSQNHHEKSKYEELMLTTKGIAQVTSIKADTPGKLWHSQNSGFPNRLLLPRGWTEGMPMQLFTVVTPMEEQSVSKAHIRPLRRKLQKCSPDGKAYGFPFDRPLEQEQSFQQPNMFFKDVKIYHDEDYLLKNFRAAKQYEKV